MMLALAVTTALAGATASNASATSASFCGNQYTPAHGWCYYGVPYPWKYVQAYYSGSGSFSICAAFNNYYSRVTLFKTCAAGFTGGCYYGGDGSADAGVGNTDGNRHTIAGYTDNTSC